MHPLAWGGLTSNGTCDTCAICRTPWRDSVRIGNREYERGMAFLALERHKNRNLPEIALPVSKEEYDKRMLDAQDSIREFLIKDEILTIPDYASARLAQEVPWTERPGGKRNFWEEIHSAIRDRMLRTPRYRVTLSMLSSAATIRDQFEVHLAMAGERKDGRSTSRKACCRLDISMIAQERKS